MTDICSKIHDLFNNLKRYSFPFNKDEIPFNGLYVLFEKDEKAHNKDRIVRVGTHTGLNQLRSRLKQHFLSENKDRSIFRKNIGRSILNMERDPYLDKWEIDLTSREAKEKFFHLIDFKYQLIIEKKVSKYIQDNFTLSFIEIMDKSFRLEIEEKIISAISLCDECQASNNWLGLYSPKEKIKKSGMWLEQGLYKRAITLSEFEKLLDFQKIKLGV